MSQVKIKELRLRNYRAFSDVRLLLDDITFLVGRNGAGKSTLMDAMSFMSEAVTDSLSRRSNDAGTSRECDDGNQEKDPNTMCGLPLS